MIGLAAALLLGPPGLYKSQRRYHLPVAEPLPESGHAIYAPVNRPCRQLLVRMVPGMAVPVVGRYPPLPTPAFLIAVAGEALGHVYLRTLADQILGDRLP